MEQLFSLVHFRTYWKKSFHLSKIFPKQGFMGLLKCVKQFRNTQRKTIRVKIWCISFETMIQISLLFIQKNISILLRQKFFSKDYLTESTQGKWFRRLQLKCNTFLFMGIYNPDGRFIVQFGRIQTKTMEENLFRSHYEQPLGQLLFTSSWKASQSAQSTPVYVYQKVIKHNDMHLPFDFDLRFLIRESFIHFFIQEREQKFQLIQGDQEKWRQILKAHLNQIGFHQHYKPLKKIGKGNFASVYLVQSLKNEKQYAVKAFAKEAAYSEQKGKECLIKQIEIMRHLNNPHNMKLCEVFQSDNSLYIVFELLDGGQLYEKIKNKEKFKPHQVRRIVKDILQGLKEMHSKNIMHRDLKPENILFRSKGSLECVIADYGLAEFADSEEYLFMRCGTPGYVAPQVINLKDMKSKYKPICDIFSLGLIFHILLFGKSIFKGKTYNEVLAENRVCSFSLQAPQYEHVDHQTMDLLRKMLKVIPEERISAKQALQHQYFQDDSKENDEVIVQLLDKVQIVGESPLLTTANEKRKLAKDLVKDSCLDFKMAKDNIITGKTETVGSVKLSGFGASLLKGFKPSKFVKPSENKQNI